ncbi:uncharacterized protein TNCV_5088791 [Trichonephila clavipes]|nr:uncharacterized protein TNCV_5088791 [Trichonephila clavipes]
MSAKTWDLLERQSLKNIWIKLWPDLDGEKDFSDDHREKITNFVQSIREFQECDGENAETWMACDAEDCGFQMLNDDEIVTSCKKDPTLSIMKRMNTRRTTTTKLFRVRPQYKGRLLHVSQNVGLARKTEPEKYIDIKLWLDLDGEKDFHDDHSEKITDFVQFIPGFQECDEDVEPWMTCDAGDCGFQMLNDGIVTSVQEESDPIDDETNEDEDNNNNQSSKGPSNADAFSLLETAMERYEQQSECSPTQVLLLKIIRHLSAKRRRCIMVKRKISYFSTIKVKLQHFAPILLFLHMRFPHMMTFNIHTVSGFIYCMDPIRLSEQSRIRMVSGLN